MSNSRGMHKVEFYMALDETKELYGKGYVVFTILYEEMKKRHNWSMSYWSFCKYAKKELLGDSRNKTLLNDWNIIQKSDDSTQKKDAIIEPIILDYTKQNKKNIYNGSTKNIKRDEI